MQVLLLDVNDKIWWKMIEEKKGSKGRKDVF